MGEMSKIEQTNTIQRLNETRVDYLKKTVRLTSTQPNLPKKWRKVTQINKVRDEKGDTFIENKEIQRLTRTYYLDLYSTKLEH